MHSVPCQRGGAREVAVDRRPARVGDVRDGTTGKAVPGYLLKVVDEDDQPVADGEIGELLVNGPTAAMAYWNRDDTSGRYSNENPRR